MRDIQRKIRQAQCVGIVRNAVLSGRLIRPQTCPTCGRNQVQGHHDDYSKPLDVQWVCPSCHAVIRFGKSEIEAACPECGQRMVRSGKVKVGSIVKQQYLCVKCRRRTLNPQEIADDSTTAITQTVH